MPQITVLPVYIQGKGWMSFEKAREALRLNFHNPVWSDVEAEIVDTCNILEEAWELYQIAYGSNHRTFEAVRRRWYRSHSKVQP